MEFEEADAINQGVRVLCLRSRARAAALLSDIGLYPGQEVLLLQLAKVGPLNQAQLSDRLNCEPPSITLMAQKLEAGGLIKRRSSTTDRRTTIVELTQAGHNLIEPIRERWRVLANETVAHLDKDAVANLALVLSRMGNGLASEGDD